MGIQIQDPIKPLDGKQGNSMSPHPTVPANSSGSPPTPTTFSHSYPTVQPGITGPIGKLNMRSVAGASALPQPGAFPMPLTPDTTAEATMPPPSKAGKKIQLPAYHAPPSSPRSFAPHTSYIPPNSPVDASRRSKASIDRPTPTPTLTSTSTPSSSPRRLPSGEEASLEHPPGYTQNPFASEMTPEQRFAVQQEKLGQHQQKMSTDLGYVPNRSRAGSLASPIFDDAGEAWDSARKWANQTGGKLVGQLGDLHGRFWDSVEGRK